MLHARLFGALVQLDCVFQCRRRRLFAINVLAGIDGFAEQVGTQVCAGRIEKQCVFRVGDGGIQVGGPARHTMFLGEGFDLLCITANKYRVRHDGVAIGQFDAAFFHDGQHRPD